MLWSMISIQHMRHGNGSTLKRYSPLPQNELINKGLARFSSYSFSRMFLLLKGLLHLFKLTNEKYFGFCLVYF